MIRMFKAITLILLFASPLLAQQASINGKVISSEDSTGLPGVSVVVEGTTNGTITDVEGNYSINVKKGANLLFSYIGFVQQKISVGDQTKINIVLNQNSTELDEVVVTGYNTQVRRNITGAVATVSSQSFKDMPIASMDQAIQGQAAGVLVTQSSGTPGGGIKVVVRGNTSISAGNRPLFLVDGVQVEDGALSQIGFGGQNDNALSTLNPNDIENITILKDVAAKALYGSRASNGVVIITTKRGKANKTRFSFDVQRGQIDVTNRVELLNSTELLELQREAVANSGNDPDEFGLIKGVTDGVNTDWQEEVLRKGIFQQYQVTASGGNDKTKFYFSGNYRGEEGVQVNNEIERYTGTLNLDHNATSRLSFGNNLTISSTRNKRVKSDNYLDAVYSGALQTLPYYAPYDEMGRLIGYGAPGFPELNGNPLGNALFPRYNVNTTKVLGGLFARYQIATNISFRSQVSIDYNGVVEDQFQPTTTIIGGDPEFVGGKGYGISASATYTTLINNNVLNFSKTIGNHNFSGLLGTEILRRIERSNSVQGRQFPSDDFTYITSAGIVDQGSSFVQKGGLVSAFGEIRYNYNEKYLFSFSAREDGSSNFGPNRKFGFFPSISAGWNISSEKFLENYEFISLLKLRASAGFTGNERIPPFRYLGTWASSTYNGTAGLGPSGLDNSNLHWESTREVNFGMDISLFNNRISTTVDAYHNLTTDLLFAEPIPLTTGYGTVQGNIGSMSNKGIEFSLNTVNLDRDFKWSTSINFSRNINRIEDLSDSVVRAGYQATGANSTNIVKEGGELGMFEGLKFLGVDPATGDAIYQDTNGDGNITPDDAVVIGSPQPDFLGGVTNRLSFKGFDLSIFFQFSYGNDILNFSNTSLLNAGEDLNSNQTKDALKRWRKPGDITSVPRYEYENTYNNRFSSRLIEDGSYLRLKNVTLGYNLPLKYAGKIFASNIRIYVSGTNIWTLTSYSGGDPEVSTLDGSTTAQGIDLFTLPQTKVMMGGLTVTF